jgi:hypothetical protein
MIISKEINYYLTILKKGEYNSSPLQNEGLGAIIERIGMFLSSFNFKSLRDATSKSFSLKCNLL